MSGKMTDLAEQLVDSVSRHSACNDGRAHLEIHQNEVVGTHLVPGLLVEAHSRANGVDVTMQVEDNAVLEKPVQICFGVLPEEGLQQINLDVRMGKNARASFEAFCTFPNARRVQHVMDARLVIEDGAQYAYFERHVHGPQGGVEVIPHAEIFIGKHASFKTEFELIKGAVGLMDIDYTMHCDAYGVFEMLARIFGRGDDRVKIREAGFLNGEGSRGALTSHIALRDRARAEIYNELIADAPYARGHVDCKEIIRNEAVAKAVPVVEVRHPRAHVTHEAAIGSVDSTQLQTLMARGLDEEAASDLIIRGMLS
jgi:hypothetical protein